MDINDNGVNFSDRIKELEQIIEPYTDEIPESRPPEILICGKMGVGKTTTINTFFGIEVGKVGDDTRGTTTDTVYEWISTENINIVDVPGLGDSETKDEEYKKIYRQKAKESDAFIVVVSPPRPCGIGTLTTVKTLIESGVPSKSIIFGYNQLSFLSYTNENGKKCRVEVGDNGITGLNAEHTKVVDRAKKQFLADLQIQFPNDKFLEKQIIEYDSETGWNLHKMFIAAIEILPTETYVRLEKVLRVAEKKILDDVIGELEKKVENERKRADDANKKLKNIEGNNVEKQILLNREMQLQKDYASNLSDELNRIKEFMSTSNEIKLTMLDKIYYGVEGLLELTNPLAAETVKNLRHGLEAVGKEVKKRVDNFVKGVEKKWNDFKNFFGF